MDNYMIKSEQDAYRRESKRTGVQITEHTESDQERDGSSHGDDPTTPSAISRLEQLMERLWAFEIFALVVSTLALLGLIILLRVTNGQKVPNWTIKPKHTKPFTVTINSVISIFSTAVKSTVLIPVAAAMGELKWMWFNSGHRLTDIQVFESAARGPLGAAIMLWSFRGRSLACLGAVIILGSLALDFGFQQLVTYPLRPVNLGPATIARTNEYFASRPGWISGTPLAEQPMVAAIYTGMYGDGKSFPVTPGCSTGNCTWMEDYTSLGFCSRCYSTTDQIVKQCGTFNYTTFDENGEPLVVGDPIPYCNYTMPSGQFIAGVNLTQGYVDPVFVDIDDSPASEKTYFGKPLTANVATLSVMRAEWQSVYDDQDRFYDKIIAANATECGIDACVIKYHATLEKSNFTEMIIDTFINETDRQVFSEGDAGYTMPVYIHPPQSWTNHSNVNDSNIYFLDSVTIQALRFQFNQNANQLLWGGRFIDSMRGQVSVDNDFVAYVRYLDEAGMKDMMSSLTSSMTQRIRTAPGAGTNSYGPGHNTIGITTQHMPHVNVRWGWIALPAAILLLSALLLVCTMIESKRQGATMLWKSNALAHFYHPLTKEGRNRLRDAHSAKHAEKIAQDMTVKWQVTDEGGRFVPINGS
ncbi:hypothetical protein G647_07642 [Cladophialophora carrionii CBS 160.54]|uniref:Uncharacterized protein n=1 Tax=Cladophialophora carrionii CBS 160.54 TaxID=1279043 RepID=V9D3Q7_9EURO|nr:uncharacterized protein G647_07642 [Cladophialophora carrionii CBS 160.54]ETI21296.1 hypothetical protein G647_07642 [Cladophialophora carrionii CBS 160.54]